MKKNEKIKNDNILLTIFLYFLVIGIYLEILTLGIAIFGADKVECNLLGCTFSTERTKIDSRQSCSENGKKINCSNFVNKYPDSYYHHGERTINAVCESEDCE